MVKQNLEELAREIISMAHGGKLCDVKSYVKENDIDPNDFEEAYQLAKRIDPYIKAERGADNSNSIHRIFCKSI